MICNKKMTIEDCELTLLRHAVEEAENIQTTKLITPDVKEIIHILKDFMIDKKVICYGGTAINNILPKEYQFYEKNEIPDFDFFSKTPLQDAKELADLYFRKGFKEVEAKAGVHSGTFKLFVNFIPIADITYLEEQIYDNIFKEAIVIQHIHYAPPNYLRMSMYLELSRPHGDVSRWKKVFARLELLNQVYPLTSPNYAPQTFELKSDIHENLLNLLISLDVVFFGGYAFDIYYKQKEQQRQGFDVLSNDYEKTGERICDFLKKQGIEASFEAIEAIGEIIPEHVDVLIHSHAVVSIYKPIACYSYNEITIHSKPVKIASIDTILSFYLAFIYANIENKDRILYMASTLFDIQQNNRGKTKGVMKRFSTTCYGEQKSLLDIRSEKTKKFKELIKKKGTEEYDWWFLRYHPIEEKKKRKTTGTKKPTRKAKTRKNRETNSLFF